MAWKIPSITMIVPANAIQPVHADPTSLPRRMAPCFSGFTDWIGGMDIVPPGVGDVDAARVARSTRRRHHPTRVTTAGGPTRRTRRVGLVVVDGAGVTCAASSAPRSRGGLRSPRGAFVVLRRWVVAGPDGHDAGHGASRRTSAC